MDTTENITYTWELLNQALVESDGAVFILNISRFKQNVASLRSAFLERYFNIGIGYSYKTNYLPRLCCEADTLGLYAEVVSGMEYEMARSLGVSGDRIIFNGPVKTPEELLRAFQDGALVNIDNLSEASLVVRLAEEHNGLIRVGLRCNLDLSWGNRESRFGLSESSGELGKACELLRQNNNISVEGLHCHTSFSRSAESYARRMQRLIELSDHIFENGTPRFLNIGGGLCGPMPLSLAEQFKDAPPSYADYAEAVCEPIRSRYGDKGPELIVEPGVGLVGNVLDYAYRVEHCKQVGTRKFVITSGASHHIKIVPNNINLPTTVYRNYDRAQQQGLIDEVDLVGFTCLEHDIIYRGLKEVFVRGDILVTSNVGAYSVVFSPEFIRTSPMVVELEYNFRWKPLRHKKTTTDLLSIFNW